MYLVILTTLYQVSLINRTAAAENLEEAKNIFAQKHGKNIMHAVLSGFAAVAPRTATPNLIELLSAFIIRYPLQSKEWINQILYSVRLSFMAISFYVMLIGANSAGFHPI